MPEFLVLLLMQVTIFSSVTALMILTVKKLFDCRIPPKIGVVLWLVLLIRLICPIFPESAFSIYNLIPAGRTIAYTIQNDMEENLELREREYTENPYILGEEAPAYEETASQKISGEDEAITIGAYLNDMIDEPSMEYTRLLNQVILMLYGAGIVLTLSVSVLCYTRARGRVYGMSVLCEDEKLLRCYEETARKMHIKPEKIPPLRMGHTDMVVGCLNPAVICRDTLDVKEAPMVFAHELSHYKYGDNPILLFSTFVTCLFWYNPLIWLVRSILREDLDVLCDARTLRECGIPRTEYAMMLCRQSAFDILHTDEVKAGCRMSATGRQLKIRLRTISRNAGERYLAKVGSLLLCTVIVLLCLTNPLVSQNDEYSAYIANYSTLTGINQRSMHLTDRVTVSTYLEQLSRILRDTGLDDFVGGGNLESFRRLYAADLQGNRELLTELQSLKTTEPLTYKNLTLLMKCAADLLSSSEPYQSDSTLPLPEVLTVSEMNRILTGLTPTEGQALLDCYNLGVSGASVDFEYVYTEAMMKLILERIDNPWIREKIQVFYQRIDLSEGTGAFSSRLTELVQGAGKKSSLFVCDPGITQVESAMLREMLGAASAGEREDVYYLKQYEDLYDRKLAAWLINRAGFTAADEIRIHAETGQLRYVRFTEDACSILTENEMEQILNRLSEGSALSFEQSYEAVTVMTRAGEYSGEYETLTLHLKDGMSVQHILDSLNQPVFTVVRDDKIQVTGATESWPELAAQELYTWGVFDDNEIHMTEHLSCGQSLSYAYRFACAITNAN